MPEKKVIVKLKKGETPDVEHIESAIKEAGLEPVRWAIVDVVENDCVILANGTEIQVRPQF